MARTWHAICEATYLVVEDGSRGRKEEEEPMLNT